MNKEIVKVEYLGRYSKTEKEQFIKVFDDGSTATISKGEFLVLWKKLTGSDFNARQRA